MNKGQHTEYIASIDNAPSTRAAQLGALSPTHNIINAGSKYLQYTVHYTGSKYLKYTVYSNQIQIFPIYRILIPGPNIYSTPLVFVTTHV